jgi:hypothetical protein
MATRKNTFLLKRSNVAGNIPTAGQIQLGELALNTADVKLYASGTTTNSILPIGWDRISRTGDTMTGTLYVPTISATTYQNLPLDIRVTGGTYAGGTATFTNNTGGTFNVTGFASTGDFIPYTGATKDADLGIHQLKADSLAISTASTESVDVGEIVWNAIDGTFDMGLIGGVTLQAGQEMHFYGKATEAISSGQAVMFAGVQGDHILIAKADAATINVNPEYFIGVATQNFVTNQFGYVTSFGNVRGLNTLGYTLGVILYYDSTTSTDGLLTATKPPAPNARIEVAAVVKVHATEGILMVRPHVMPKIDDIQNVSVTSVQNLDILQYNSSTTVWANTNTPRFTSVSATTMSAVTFTGNLTGTASLATSATTALNSTQLNGQLASFYYPASNPNGYTTNTGTVTGVNSGNGMNFSNFTTSGTITMGTPSSTTLSSINATTTNSHTHAFAPGGTTAQYITGAGTLVTFPTIPTVNNGTLSMSTSGIATGSASFTANQSGNSTFTVTVPATDLTIGSNTSTVVRVDSSTGTDATLPVATASLAGVLVSADWTTFNNKQPQLNGTGFVKAVGTTISYDNSTYYLASNPNGYTTNTGTVTGVNKGNGMDFTNFTTSGTITLGTPSSTTLASTNAVTSTSHTHAFAPGGTTAQYITGAGTLVTFPTIVNTFVTGSTINNSTYDLTLTRNDGVTIVTNLGILATDVRVTGGTYNINTGVVTFTNSTGGTFNVTGFSSGMTDTFVTGGTYSSGTATFTRSNNASFNVTGFNTGTVTAVNNGNGMDFSNFTTSGTITLGTPSSLTLSSTNAVTTNSHTHAFAPGGTAAQYITGAGTLVTFPTLPTVNNGTLTMATSGIATGSASFTANQAGTSTFTVNVPATDLTVGSNTSTVVRVDSSTGTDATLPVATASLAGVLVSADWTTFNNKQAALNGTGFVKIVGTTISYDNSSYYLASNPNGYTTNTGTVTGVNKGNGMDFSNFTTSGTITLGTPSSLTLSSTNSVTSTSHTHAFAPGGTAAQYITGAGALATFPTIPTVNDGTLTMATSGIATGSASFTANQAGTSTFTVNVPATDLSIGVSSGTQVRIDSSTGADVNIPVASATLAGIITTGNQTFSGNKTFTNIVQITSATSPNIAFDTSGTNVGGMIVNSSFFQFNAQATSGYLFKNYDGNNILSIGAIGNAQFSSSVTASSFVKTGGTSTQFLKADGSVDSTTYVPTSRTLTINGTTFDLSANRSWTISSSGGITGGGDVGYLPKFTGSTAVGNSQIYDNGTSVGINTTSPNPSFKLDVNGATSINGPLSVSGSPTTLQYVRVNSDMDLFNSHVDSENYGTFSRLRLSRASGTQVSPTTPSSGTAVGRLEFGAYNSGTGTFIMNAKVEAVMDATTGANDLPSRLSFFTTPDGSTTMAEVMRVNSLGNMRIGGLTMALSDVINVENGSVAFQNGYGLRFQSTGGTLYASVYSSNNDTVIKSLGDAIRFKNRAGTANRMSILDGGFVGVNTNTPNQWLDVNGDALINGLTVGLGSGAYNNAVLGNQALGANTTGYNNVAIHSALPLNTTGTNNVGVGYKALFVNTIGNDNVAVGVGSLQLNTSGEKNISIGSSSSYNNDNGEANIAIGTNALFTNVNSGSNVAMGYNALYTNTGAANLALGHYAGYTLDGDGNNIIGTSNNQLPDANDLSNQNNTLSISKHTQITKGMPHFWAPDSISISPGSGYVLEADPLAYSAVFIDYSLEDQNGNLRAGTLKAIFNVTLATIKWDEVATSDIGSTSNYTFDFMDNGNGILGVELTNSGGVTVYCNLTSRLVSRTIL